MPVSLIPSFILYCFFSGITPGPANLCSLTTAMKEGRAAALRQWRGLFTGFAIVSLASVLICYFLGSVLGDNVRFLAFIGAAYLLFMAFQILRPVILHSPGETEAQIQDRGTASFLTGLMVQLTNVKIMVFCMTALSSYVLPYSGSFLHLLAVGAILPFTGPICNLAWLFAGVRLQDLFRRHRTACSVVLALSLVWCAISLIIG